MDVLHNGFQYHFKSLLWSLISWEYKPSFKGKIFCAEFLRYSLKFHTKYLIHTSRDIYFFEKWIFQELPDLRVCRHFWNHMPLPHAIIHLQQRLLPLVIKACDSVLQISINESAGNIVFIFRRTHRPEKYLGTNYMLWNIRLRRIFLTNLVYRYIPQWPLLLTWFNFNPSMDK